MRINKGASRLEQDKQGGEEPQEEIRWESRGQVMGGVGLRVKSWGA